MEKDEGCEEGGGFVAGFFSGEAVEDKKREGGGKDEGIDVREGQEGEKHGCADRPQQMILALCGVWPTCTPYLLRKRP